MDRDRGGDRPVPARGAFVGRGADLELGDQALIDTLGGRGRLVLIAGAPGIGKSRLADELGSAALGRGFRVVWGRCWEAGGAPAYWPWVQLLRSLTATMDVEQLRTRAGHGAAELAQLLPELAGLQPTEGMAPAGDPDAARFRLFDAVSGFLRATAGAAPLMVVLDDLHAADTPSVLLLRFIADGLGTDRLMVLGTYRDSEFGPAPAPSAELTELARQPSVGRILLRGLSRADASRLVETMAGMQPAHELIEALHDRTGGNPLFLQEGTRLLIEAGRLEAGTGDGTRPTFPRTVREVIAQRLKPFSAATLDILTKASILGRGFELQALSRLVQRPVDEVWELLQAPLEGRVLLEGFGSGADLRFSHVVVRESLYDGVPPAQRRLLHRLAGGVLEDLYRDDLDPHLAELAHHFCSGAAAEHAEKAVAYARAAGRRAVALLAYEEAVRLFGMALRALEVAETKPPEMRCDILIELGDAQSRAGDETGRKASFLQAAELSRALGSGQRLARAAMGYGGQLAWVRAGDDAHLIRLLEDGLAAVGAGDSIPRSGLLARLAGALRDDPSPERREAVGREAVAMARRLGDQHALAYALEGLFAALWRPGNAPERLGVLNEIIAVGERTGDRERIMAAHGNRAHVFLEPGDIDAAADEIDVVEQVGRELRQPAHSWIPLSTRAELALLRGRFELVAPLVAEAFEIRSRTNRSDAVLGRALQTFQLCREQGRPQDADDLVQDAARQLTWYPVTRCALACLHLDLGREARARSLFESLAADDFAGVPFDNKWLFAVSLLSEVACRLDDGPRVRLLYELLLPYESLCSVAGGDICAGSMGRHLGVLAAASGHADEAAVHLDGALRRNEQMGARPAAAHAAFELAAVLAGRDRAADGNRAATLLRAAGVVCEELGMATLRAAATDALTAAAGGDAGTPVPAQTAPPGTDEGSCRLEGEYWAVGYGGRLVRLRDTKGMRLLACLLAHPGRPFPALDLERLGVPGDEATVRAVAAGDSGELLDGEARRAYGARMLELRAAIDEAEADGRGDQVSALHEELDFITRELSRALGLGGRSRRAGSAAERARINVTRALRSAMQRIAAADAALADHMDACVRTGTVCVYRPDPRAPIAWRVSSD